MTRSTFGELLNTPINALDFRFMIGDIRDFIEFSEQNIEWQYQREVQKIDTQDAAGYEIQERDSLLESLEHRFKISLALRVRYGALTSFLTSVEWALKSLSKPHNLFKGTKPKNINESIHHLVKLLELAKIDQTPIICDLKNLIVVRNCVVHSAGIVSDYQYKKDLIESLDSLNGIVRREESVIGDHIHIERGALEPYIDCTSRMVVDLYDKLES